MNYRSARLVLGTNSSSTYTEIKRAFRRRALEDHPDKHSDKWASTRKFSNLVSAYRCLMAHRSPFQASRYRGPWKRRHLALVKLR